MFWKFNLLTTSQVDTLLDKEDVTLDELMDEDDILQECKAQNRKLIDFLVQQENITELVRLITEEPRDDLEEKVKYKYPNTACELLTSDVSQINEALAGNVELVQKLYSFLDKEHSLNPLLASFFSKVMGLLITRKSEMILDFLKSRSDFVGTLLHHIGTSAIMDLLLRLLTCIELPEVKQAMHEWLNEQKIVQKLVNCITPAYDEDIHCNAAQSLCDIIRLGREHLLQFQERSEPDLLLSVVEMQDNVTQLLDNMLSGEKNESVIVSGLTVIQTLLEFKKQSPEDSVEQMTMMDSQQMSLGMNNVLKAVCPRLKDFQSILLDPPKQRFCVMQTTIGLLDPPLGNTRLQICKLLASLLVTNSHSINVELARLGTINILMDLFFQYLWNNFLHTHVTQCVNTILINPAIEIDGIKECPLLYQLFKEGQLIHRVLQEWESNDRQQTLSNGKRKGFMGHLTKVANEIVNAHGKGENMEAIKGLVSELPEEMKAQWESFLSGSLAEANKRNTVDLVQGQGLGLTSSSEDDDADFTSIPFPQDTAMQQAFSDYQLQQMTSNFIDQFGFNEEEFAENEEKMDSPFRDNISSIDFSGGVTDTLRPNVTRFEQYCNERLQQFDNDSDEDIWEEKDIAVSPTTQQQKRIEHLPVSRSSNDDSDRSTDSKEDLDLPQRIVPQQPVLAEKMDIDSNEVWAGNFEEQGTQVTPVSMETSPWDNISTLERKNLDALHDTTWADFPATKPTDEQQETEKWADFTNKIPEENGEKIQENWTDFANFDSLKSEPRSSSPVAMDTTEASSGTNIYCSDSVDKQNGTDVLNSGQEVKQSLDIAISTNQHTQSVENEKEQLPTLPSSPPPDDGCHENQSLVSTFETVTSTDMQAQGDGFNAELVKELDGGAALDDNFDFLMKIGLMKSGGAPNCLLLPDVATVEVAELQGNGPINDIAMDKLEELRTQAKDALDSYDTAIKSSIGIPNGPV